MSRTTKRRNPTGTDIVRRAVQSVELVASARRHLLEDQEDAIHANGSDSGEGSRGGGHSDPTPRMAALLAPFAAKERRMREAMAGVDRAFDELERAVTAAISPRAPVEADTEERCPGWSVDLRARLGGCGKILERYRLGNGDTVVRPERLCAGCRTAKRRDEAA